MQTEARRLHPQKGPHIPTWVRHIPKARCLPGWDRYQREWEQNKFGQLTSDCRSRRMIPRSAADEMQVRPIELAGVVKLHQTITREHEAGRRTETQSRRRPGMRNGSPRAACSIVIWSAFKLLRTRSLVCSFWFNVTFSMMWTSLLDR